MPDPAVRKGVPARLRSLLLAPLLLLPACAHNLGALRDPPRSYAVPTSATWSSMVYAARTDSGVVVVDLGWFGAERPLRGIVARLGARPEEVTHVFLTHSHRDHVGAWRAVRDARFHLPDAETPYLVGEARHRDLPSRLARSLFGRGTPRHGEVEIRPFSRDTAFVLGADTLHAFVARGHTPGHAAYLFRGVLFVGDAVRRSPLRGWGGAARIFTHDRAQARLAGVAVRAGAPARRGVGLQRPREVRPSHPALPPQDHTVGTAAGSPRAEPVRPGPRRCIV